MERSFNEFFKTLSIMIYRELKRFLRARSRLIGAFVNPLIWFVFFGLGWSSVFNVPFAKALFYGLDYLSFLAPGMVLMAIFTGSFASGISLIWDREFGFLKEVLVAPSSRTAAIIGRAMGGSIVAVIQGGLILALAFFLAESLKVSGVPMALGVGFLVALAFSSMGMAMASKMRSLEGFQLIMNFIMLPIIFLSGAFYPIDQLPWWMKDLAYINPLTYGVDATRYFLTGVHTINLNVDIMALLVLTVIFSSIAAYLFHRSYIG